MLGEVARQNLGITEKISEPRAYRLLWRHKSSALPSSAGDPMSRNIACDLPSAQQRTIPKLQFRIFSIIRGE